MPGQIQLAGDADRDRPQPASRTSARMPRIGPPMVTGSPGARRSLMLVMMVVSVGP